jgi:hypothetical protein
MPKTYTEVSHPSLLQSKEDDGWRNIAITLINLRKGE